MRESRSSKRVGSAFQARCCVASRGPTCKRTDERGEESLLRMLRASLVGGEDECERQRGENNAMGGSERERVGRGMIFLLFCGRSW